MATKDDIRPIYAELQGFLLEAPDDSKTISESPVWELYNQSIDALIQLGLAYERFKITPETHHAGGRRSQWVRARQYRIALSGTINRLHAEFFRDEPSPFAGSPGMVISQNQQQSQVVYIQMIMEVQEQLTRSEAKFKEDSKERSFIDKAKDLLKAGVSGIASTAQLMLLLLSVAKECGLSVEDMQRVFGG